MNEEPRPTTTISDELVRLGRQLVEAGRLAWESEDRKRLQTEMAENLRRFGDQIETGIEQARASDTTKQVTEQAQKVAAKVQDAHVVDEVRDSLTVGLTGLNRELSRLIDRLATRTAPTGGAPVGDATPVSGGVAAEPTTPPDVPLAPQGPGDPAI